MDPALEEASLSSGAGLWRTTTRVTLPLVLPAILASSLLVFVLAAEQFGVPAVLGTPARIRVLTTSIVATNTFYPPQHGLGAALCVTLLIIALVGLWLQRRMLRRPLVHDGRRQGLAAAPDRARTVPLGAARRLLPLPPAGGRAAVLDDLPELDPHALDRRLPLGAVHPRSTTTGSCSSIRARCARSATACSSRSSARPSRSCFAR